MSHLTIFTIPKPFLDPLIITIQTNAINSWKMLSQKAEIFVCGNDEGVKKVAQELQLNHIPDIEKNEYNTPLLSSAFETIIQKALSPLICYLNCDIILYPDFAKILSSLSQFNEFLAVGRRIDVDITKPIQFNNGWDATLLAYAQKSGKMHGPSGIDYFIFPKKLSIKMKQFPVGRPCWDNWFIFEARTKNIPVIDVTATTAVIHQNHHFKHHKEGKSGVLYGKEAQKNRALTQNSSAVMNIMGASHILTSDGFRKPSWKRRFYAKLIMVPPTRKLFSWKRMIQRSFLNLKT